MTWFRWSKLLLFTLLISSCGKESEPTTENEPPFEYGPSENRYETHQEESQMLSRALASLPAFYGDGQLRWYSGSWHGSAFLFSPSTIMTNAHVVTTDTNHQIKRPFDELEFIVFPYIVFYKKSLYERVKKYEEERYARMLIDHEKAKDILKKRIARLKEKKTKNRYESVFLDNYQSDLESLNHSPPVPVSAKEFLAVEDSIQEVWTHGHNSPDIALIVLKKPLKNLLKNTAIINTMNDSYFAINNLYNYTINGRLFSRTPLYIAGYGRETNGSTTDKNKNLKVLLFSPTFFQSTFHLAFYFFGFPAPTDFEKDFYYFEKSSTQGDSGSRIWAFLDEKRKLSVTPKPLTAPKITIGITSTTGGGEILSQSNVRVLLDKFSHDYPNIYRTELSGINFSEWAPVKVSSTLPYLSNLDQNTPDDFFIALYYHLLWKELSSEVLHGDLEKANLWRFSLNNIVFLKPTLKAIRDKNGFIFGQFGNKFNKRVVTAYRQKLGNRSPSDLTLEKWVSLILDGGDLKDQEKILLKKMYDGKLFENFHSLKVKIKNLTAPLSVDAYLKAYEQWVERNAYNNSHYLRLINRKDLDMNRSFPSIESIIALDD